MERAIRIHIERLPEGVFLGTSPEVAGLVAQGRTVAETLEIARDLARKILEIRSEWAEETGRDAALEAEYQVVVAV